MSVLLADSGITSLLGSASARPTEAGQFAFIQDFLAQTAMIASEAPNLARSLVIAPPTDWDPSPGRGRGAAVDHAQRALAAPGRAGALAAQATTMPSTSLPAKQVSGAELSATYLDHVKQVQASTALFTNLLYQPSARVVTSLQAAVTATVSAAWRGSGSPDGWRVSRTLDDYLRDSEHKVQIITGRKLFLTGTSGETPVSVRNLLSLPIQVRVMASMPPGSQLAVGRFNSLLMVQGKNQHCQDAGALVDP